MRMGKLFKVLCGCCLTKKRNLGSGGSPKYTRVPTDEFAFDDADVEEGKGPAAI